MNDVYYINIYICIYVFIYMDLYVHMYAGGDIRRGATIVDVYVYICRCMNKYISM